MNNKPKLSVVIPCFNESKNVLIVLEKFQLAIKDIDYPVEIIIVDGSSTDNTPQVLQKAYKDLDQNIFKLILLNRRQGYGHDIMHALSQASGDILSWTHADMQTDPADIFTAYARYAAAGNADPVFIKGKRKNRRFVEFIFTFSMQIVVFLVLGCMLDDINAQPKLFSRSFYNDYLQYNAPDDFSLDLYALYMAKKNAYTILTIPVYFAKRQHGEAKGGGGGWRNRMKLCIRTFKYIFKLRRQFYCDAQAK